MDDDLDGGIRFEFRLSDGPLLPATTGPYFETRISNCIALFGLNTAMSS